MRAISSFIRRLREDPEFREEVRRIILTDELLALPARVESLRAEVHEEFRRVWEAIRALTERMDRVEAQIAALVEAQRRTEDRLGWVEDRLGRVEDRLGDLSGVNLEAEWVRKAPSILGGWFRRVRVLIGEDLWDLLHGAEDRGVLSHGEALDIARADVIVECREKEGKALRVVVEVSWTVSGADVQRARRRADLLSRLGVPTVAIAAGREVSEEVREEARALGVWVIEDGRRVVGPEE